MKMRTRTGNAVHRQHRAGAVETGSIRFVDGPARHAGHHRRVSGSRLEINAAVKPGGSLTRYKFWTGGRAIPGFGISESLRDQLRHAVRWTGKNLASLAGKPVSLVFALSRAELLRSFRES